MGGELIWNPDDTPGASYEPDKLEFSYSREVANRISKLIKENQEVNTAREYSSF